MIVKNFSRATMKQMPYSNKEYYICINSSGGPHAVPVLDVIGPNVLNIWFDDVVQDERKWGENVQFWFDAKAITFDQADTLYNFIKIIPQDAIVNVYCSAGVCRSGAVSTFLKNEYNAELILETPIEPNPRVLAFLYNAKYKYIQPINFKFNLDELRDYYYTIENNFQHLKWTVNPDEVYGSEQHQLDGFYGWGIQSNLDDLTKPCPPYDVHKHGSKTYRNTELVFGFAKKLLERFPYARQLGIAVHPKNISIGQHLDNDEYVKIHFPIFKTPASYFSFGEHKFILEPGLAYLVDTRYMHGTSQEGDSQRVHLLLKLSVDYIEDALK